MCRASHDKKGMVNKHTWTALFSSFFSILVAELISSGILKGLRPHLTHLPDTFIFLDHLINTFLKMLGFFISSVLVTYGPIFQASLNPLEESN